MNDDKQFRDRTLLVLQHHPAEHLGRFAPMLAADGIQVRTVQLDQGETIPCLDGIDAVWALGGPMQAWQEDQHPWLAAEKLAIREAVFERRLPFFGLCLGHQLLADSLGGEVAPAAAPEVGILPIEFTEAGCVSPLFSGLGPMMSCTQGHGAEVRTAPPGCEILARSKLCHIQALAWGDKAFSLQFHSELTLDMIDACLELPEYKTDFEAMLGADGIEEFRRETMRRSQEFEKDARTLYRNWINCAFG